MCDRVVRHALVAALLAAPAAAQRPNVLQQRADSLLELWRDTAAIADIQDSLRGVHQGGGRVTVRAGGLTIIANPSPLPLRAAAELAWTVIDSVYGSAAAAVAANRRLVVDVIDAADTTRRRPADADIHVLATLSAAELARTLVNASPLDPGDGAWSEWLGGRLLQAVSRDREAGGVYIEFVTAPSVAVRRCFRGGDGGAACGAALEIAADSEPFLAWYDAAERARLIRESFAYYFGRGKTQAQYNACTERQDDAACVELFHAIPPGAMPRPLSVGARRSLALLALSRGGRDAYRRLMASPGLPIGERLARAAGLSSDSLVTLWRTDILAARPLPVTLPWWAVAFAVGWVAAFGACGLRSSRWRLG